MISPLVKKIIKCANSKKIILKKININIPVKERIGTNFENLHFLVTEDKSIKHFNKILFRFKNKLKKKNRYFSFYLLRHGYEGKPSVKDNEQNLKKNKKPKVYTKEELKLKKNKRLKIKKYILKEILSKNISTVETNYYLKKLLDYFLSFYSLKVDQLEDFFKKSNNKVLPQFISNNILPQNEIILFQHLYFLLLTRSKLTKKYEFYLQKKFVFFLIKNRKLILQENEYAFLISFLKAYIQASYQRINIKKENLLNFKKALSVIYSKKRTTKENDLRKKLIGLTTKKGDKSKGLKLVQKGLILTSAELKMPVALILKEIFKRLKTSVESKKIQVRRTAHFVPFPVNLKRKIYLAAKWILLGTKKSKIKGNFSLKLQTELIKLITRKQSVSFRTKKYHVFKSLKSRSNSHFRW